jgi:putative transposase
VSILVDTTIDHVAPVAARIADRRRDPLHKLTTRLVGEDRTIVIAVDRWYPSSKTCSRCGHLLDALPLGVREWTCPGCGDTHDRDVNAAINILAAGLVGAACGDGVRPTRRQSVRHLSKPPFQGGRNRNSPP